MKTTFQYVIKELKKVTPGGVYLGVGPDQNFTYVVRCGRNWRLSSIFAARICCSI